MVPEPTNEGQTTEDRHDVAVRNADRPQLLRVRRERCGRITRAISIHLPGRWCASAPFSDYYASVGLQRLQRSASAASYGPLTSLLGPFQRATDSDLPFGSLSGAFNQQAPSGDNQSSFVAAPAPTPSSSATVAGKSMTSLSQSRDVRDVMWYGPYTPPEVDDGDDRAMICDGTKQQTQSITSSSHYMTTSKADDHVTSSSLFKPHILD